MLLLKALNIFYMRKPNLTASQKDDCPFWPLKIDPKQWRSCAYPVSEIELMRRIFSFYRVRFTYVALGWLSLLFSDLNVIQHRLEGSSPHTLLSLWLSLGQGPGICIAKLPGEARTNSFIRHSRHSAVVHFTFHGPGKWCAFNLS